jgi:hypothetical protein
VAVTPPARGCLTDLDCGAPTPYCNVLPEPNICVECLVNEHCGGVTPVCDWPLNLCRRCWSDIECGEATPACQPSGACGQCSATNTSLCGAEETCDTVTGVCVLPVGLLCLVVE